MKRFNFLTYFYLFLLFLSGAVVGVFGHRLYTINSVSASTRRSPEEFKRKYMAEMTSRLALNPDQASKLSGILDETRRRFHEQHERSKPELDAIQHDQVAKVRAVLNDTQRTEYEKMRQEREKRHAAEAKARW